MTILGINARDGPHDMRGQFLTGLAYRCHYAVTHDPADIRLDIGVKVYQRLGCPSPHHLAVVQMLPVVPVGSTPRIRVSWRCHESG